jgi:hypothetical protein
LVTSTLRIWIDLSNSPHVPFFQALIPELELRGAWVKFSARQFAQTVELAEQAQLAAEVIGEHGGRSLYGKAGNLFGRVQALRNWARSQSFDLAVSHNSYAQIVAAKTLGLPVVTLMDYEHQPANHLAFRLASRVIVPRSFPGEALARFGARETRVRRYDGIKEDVYLAGFQPDPEFPQVLGQLDIDPERVLIVVRPPARDALYHRFENELFHELMESFAAREDVSVLFLPRSEGQGEKYGSFRNFKIPEHALHGANLIAAADVVVSAGGTMNREAAALGVPAVTVYAGKWAAVDEELVQSGRLVRLRGRGDIARLKLIKKTEATARHQIDVRRQVAELILGADNS